MRKLKSDILASELYSTNKRIREIENKLKSLSNRKFYRESGRSGCTYGDTEYDSASVAYGYNMAIDNVEEELKQLGNLLKN